MTPFETPVEALMSPEPVTLAPGDSVREALAMLERYSFRHFPVEEENRLVGIVSDRDLAWSWALPRGPRGPGRAPRRERTVAEILRPDVITVGPATSAHDAVELLIENRIGALPVIVADRRIVGIVTETDYLRLFGNDQGWQGGQAPGQVKVADRMSNPVHTTAPEDDFMDAAERLLSARVRHLPVVRDGAILGMLSDRDVRRGLARMARDDRGIEARSEDWLPRLRVEDVYSSPCVTISEDETLRSAAHMLIEYRIGALPVVRGQELVGVITPMDLLRHFREHRG